MGAVKKKRAGRRATARTSRRPIPDKPTPDEWATFSRSQRCVVVDADGQEHIFNSGDESVSRSSPEMLSFQLPSPSVMVDWASVYWFWSGEDIRQQYHGRIETSSYGIYERSLEENKLDYMSMQSIDSKVNVRMFEEQCIEQDPIPKNSFYVRRKFCTNNGDGVRAHLTPHARVNAKCTCNQAYNPDTDEMRFCPRETCRTWYHTICLDRTQSYFDEDEHMYEYPESLIRGSLDETSTHCDLGMNIASLCTPNLAKLFARVNKLAKQPIVRGRVHGVSGNVHLVLMARRWDLKTRPSPVRIED
ncbi:hypothetical protein K488DRAFT_86209 [Vararia minispora EC-137]|uniref:Uncharacterized protein n=1 Tax=Vararia minispora EC-137 TaxID=1314806 RepID=A0ACB8QJM7_9AGAM|nr:hypothetical protein K488DRAFT_86209 [Vararia minispora EC-137]